MQLRGCRGVHLFFCWENEPPRRKKKKNRHAMPDCQAEEENTACVMRFREPCSTLPCPALPFPPLPTLAIMPIRMPYPPSLDPMSSTGERLFSVRQPRKLGTRQPIGSRIQGQAADSRSRDRPRETVSPRDWNTLTPFEEVQPARFIWVRLYVCTSSSRSYQYQYQ